MTDTIEAPHMTGASQVLWNIDTKQMLETSLQQNANNIGIYIANTFPNDKISGSKSTSMARGKHYLCALVHHQCIRDPLAAFDVASCVERAIKCLSSLSV